MVQDTRNDRINDGADIWRSTQSHMQPDGGEGLVAQQLSMWLADNWQSLVSQLKTLKEEAALTFVEVKLKVQEWWNKLCQIVGDIVVGVVLPLLKTAADVAGAVAVGIALGVGSVAVGGVIGTGLATLAIANPVGVMVVGVGAGIAALAAASGGSGRRRRRRR